MVERLALTNRWSQAPAAVKSTFDFMEQFSMFAVLSCQQWLSSVSLGRREKTS